MTGKAHVSVGASVFVFLSQRLPGKYVLISLAFSVLGALLPDADHPKSFFNKYVLPFRNNATKVIFYCFLGILVLYIDNFYKGYPILKVLGIVLILLGLSTHRTGFTHSVFGMIIFTGILTTFCTAYNLEKAYYYFLASYASHLICDMCTKQGIPALYPLNNKKFKFPLAFSTNSARGRITENIIILLSIIYVSLSLPKFF
ncbi:MAG: metal-dependent hydrolase [Clostridium argentinense]|uniref:Metal-dependent hydrolase n=1 Tax=Clostridium faecium TaxID=2762223 RepID=A0ABR8YTX4_9CLOT|nr:MULTISPECIES: metal-dependent hydrolase [Clostridium]MBD8047700.1 metal-dependent hydrolase [Clostridium faecium]MBS5823343.1 metal-dependent hydrolase [Clostridium argentinense]MDU1348044.1 metal-dependent hydrolase [Clostridium argentinense]